MEKYMVHGASSSGHLQHTGRQSRTPQSRRTTTILSFEKRELRSKGHGKKSIHFNGSDENIELLLRRVMSANQLSIYGAQADLCNELSEVFRDSV